MTTSFMLKIILEKGLIQSLLHLVGQLDVAKVHFHQHLRFLLVMVLLLLLSSQEETQGNQDLGWWWQELFPRHAQENGMLKDVLMDPAVLAKIAVLSKQAKNQKVMHLIFNQNKWTSL